MGGGGAGLCMLFSLGVMSLREASGGRESCGTRGDVELMLGCLVWGCERVMQVMSCSSWRQMWKLGVF